MEVEEEEVLEMAPRRELVDEALEEEEEEFHFRICRRATSRRQRPFLNAKEGRNYF